MPDRPTSASPRAGTGGTEEVPVEVEEVAPTDGDSSTQETELPPGSGPDPLRFNRWMKRSTTGAVLTGVTIGLQQALEKRDQRPAFVIEAPGEPEDDEPLVRLQFDPDNPSNTVAVVRADAGHDRGPSPSVDVGKPEDSEPDR